ncbi:hypothetical protein V8E51_011096 [Hyaloscypha variabilis]
MRSSVVGFLTRKKDLERTRLENERLERELAERTRREEERIRAAALRELDEQMLRDKERRRHAKELAAIRHRENMRIEKKREKQLLEEQAIQDAKDKRKAKLQKMKESSPETLRDLRELIRNRFQMDVEIWGLRSARKPDRPKVLEKMAIADAIMDEILTTISTWENQKDGNWTNEEWVRVQEIKERLQSDGKRVWEDNPPWMDVGTAGKGRAGVGVGAWRAERW